MDLLITCEMDTLISCTRILPDLLSGHQVVVWVIDLLQSPATCITVVHWKTRDIDFYAFQKDICWVFYKESVDGLDDVITVLSFRTRESKIVSLSPVSFFEHKL